MRSTVPVSASSVNSMISLRRPVRLDRRGGVRSRRKLGRHLGDALGDELAGTVVVGVGLELDRDLADAELRARPDAPHLGQAGEADFHGHRDARLQLLGAHGRVLRDHVEDGRGEVGEDVAGKVHEPVEADGHAGRDEGDGQDGLGEEGSDEPFDHLSARAARLRRGPSPPPP